MSKWGKCDFKQLERLNKNMEKLMGADLDRFCRQAAQELAGRLLNKVVKRTPVVYWQPLERQSPYMTVLLPR